MSSASHCVASPRRRGPNGCVPVSRTSCRQGRPAGPATGIRRLVDLCLRVATLAALCRRPALRRRAASRAQWWHVSRLGHYTNSVHLWSVELFMAFMVIHLWAVLDGRLARPPALTWVTGMVAFLTSVGTAFTGYLIQTN